MYFGMPSVIKPNGLIEQWKILDFSGHGNWFFMVHFSTINYFATAIENTSDTTRNYGATNHNVNSVSLYCRNGGNRGFATGY